MKGKNILCPSCMDNVYAEVSECEHCHGTGHVDVEIDEEGRTVLAVMDALAPELAANIFDYRQIQRTAPGLEETGEDLLLTALNRVLIGIPDCAWEWIDMYHEFRASRESKACERAKPVSHVVVRTIKPVRRDHGLVYETVGKRVHLRR